MLTCEQALELISAQLDGGADGGGGRGRWTSTGQCPACRALPGRSLHPAPASAHSGGGAPRRAEGQHYESGPRLQMHPLPHQKAPVALALLGLSGRGAGACTGGRAGCAPLEPSGQLRERTQSQSCRVDRSGLRRERGPNPPRLQEDRAGPAGEPAEAASGSADGANRKDSSAGERPQNRDVTPPADGPEGGQIPASAQEPSVSAPPVSELQPTPSAGPSVMSLMPEDAPQDTQPPSSALTEEGARQALLEWLGQPDAPLTSLGRSEDGTAYRFQTEDGALYSVPLDGSPIAAEPS